MIFAKLAISFPCTRVVYQLGQKNLSAILLFRIFISHNIQRVKCWEMAIHSQGLLNTTAEKKLVEDIHKALIFQFRVTMPLSFYQP